MSTKEIIDMLNFQKLTSSISNKLLTSLLIIISLLSLNRCAQITPEVVIPQDLVLVTGGSFINNTSNLYQKDLIVSDFYLGKNEVTQKEWVSVMGDNPSKFKSENLPVEMVSWYDCIEFCNKRSLSEGLSPFYSIDKENLDIDNLSEEDSIKWTVLVNSGANGYRLPTEVEWEYAASGGQKSENFMYSGSNELNDIAWYWRNSGDTLLTGGWNYTAIEKNNSRTHDVGTKKPNELGFYDMTGNVREWCEDWYQDNNVAIGRLRVERGGGWIGGEQFSVISFRDSFEANGKGPDQGFRICRNKY